jgi:hypothetical protein
MPEKGKSVKDLRGAVSFRSGGTRQFVGYELPTTKNFSLNSYNWTENYNINGSDPLMDMTNVPKLILTEKQPIKKPDWSKVLADASALENLPGIKQIVQVFNTGPNAISQTAGANFLNKLSDKYSSNIAESKKLLDISDLEDLIEGPTINTYEIPFFNTMYLSSNNKDNWSTGSALENAGSTAELINDGFQMNILKHPQWQNSNSEGQGWDTQFYLINKDLDALQKNFTFINAIFPGTQWVRMKAATVGSQDDSGLDAAANKAYDWGTKAAEGIGVSLSYAKSPNVFRVVCPGRFIQLFVALDISVEFVGSVRRMPLHTRIQNVSMVNENTLYPDAYRVSISARDMTPTCYNVYANFLMGQEEVTVSDSTTTSQFFQNGNGYGPLA